MKRADATYSSVFLSLFALFLTCLLVSNIIAGKLILVFGLVLPAAVILFPITYILGDVFTEVYGFGKTRVVIWTGFAANAIMAAVFLAALALPFPDFWKHQQAYESVPRPDTPHRRGLPDRILGGEFATLDNALAPEEATLVAAAYCGHGRSPRRSSGRQFDTALFIGIGFAGSVPPPVLFQMMLAQYLFKVLYEVVADTRDLCHRGNRQAAGGHRYLRQGRGVQSFSHRGKMMGELTFKALGNKRSEPTRQLETFPAPAHVRKVVLESDEVDEPVPGHGPAGLGDGPHRVRA